MMKAPEKKLSDSLFHQLSKLTLSEEEREGKEENENECPIESLYESPKDSSENLLLYSSKGPVFRSRSSPNAKVTPYPPISETHYSHDIEVGKDINFFGSLLEDLQPIYLSKEDSKELDDPGIPELPKVGPHVKTYLDELFSGRGLGSQIVFKNPPGSSSEPFLILPIPLNFKIDIEERKIGITIPRAVIPNHLYDTSNTIGIYIQLDPHLRRVIKYTANIEIVSDENGKNLTFLKSQFMALTPFDERNSGVSRLLSGCSESDLESALSIVGSKDMMELFKTYGPNDDTLLSMLCFSKEETPLTRAKVLALTKKILSSPDPELRSNVRRKNKCDIGALEFAATTNKVYIAPFMAELYYDIGEDIYCTDSKGNTLLHVMARKGDVVAPTLKALLSLTFSNGRKVYPSIVKNTKDQLPMHIAALSSLCPIKTLSILHGDFPGSLRSSSSNGSLPLHLACQFSSDSTLISTLLSLDRFVVNEVRHDGLTPLHLIASRSHVSDVTAGIVPLSEDVQLDMIQLLLKNGADKGSLVENLSPYDLVSVGRSRAKSLLSWPHESLILSSSPSSQLQLDLPHCPFSAPDSGTSDEDEANNLDAIAEALYQHPSIQAAVMMADQF